MKEMLICKNSYDLMKVFCAITHNLKILSFQILNVTDINRNAIHIDFHFFSHWQRFKSIDRKSEEFVLLDINLHVTFKHDFFLSFL